MTYRNKQMSLENLPPVSKWWEPEVLDGLSRDELIKLQLMLKSKMDAVSDRYERELYRRDRDMWMQYKLLTYREKPRRDYPF